MGLRTGRIFFLMLLWLAPLSAFTGCATPEEEDPNRVSTIPWNRPERWESAGPMGSLMNTEGR
jgi:hypothetical protein